MADRHVVFKQCLKEIADEHGRERHVHGEAGRRPGRLELPHPPEPVAATGKNAFPGDARSGRCACSDAFRWFLGGWIAHAPELMVVLRADRELLQALPVAARGRRRASPGATTTAPPASASSAAGQSLRIECRIPGADCNPYLAFAALARVGPRRHREEDRAAADVRRATSTPRRTCPRVPQHAARRDGALREERVRARTRSARTSSSTTRTSSAPSRRPTTRPSPTGSASATSRGSDDDSTKTRSRSSPGAGGGIGGESALLFAAEGARSSSSTSTRRGGKETVQRVQAGRRRGRVRARRRLEGRRLRGDGARSRRRRSASSTCSSTTPASWIRQTTTP